ncbi:late competence development ComFB family protein [Bacillus sp. FJAT-49736]|uniref:late competence development ComFB family protein n=1 Tax=Bacillus sp. FJAT-49736 TaxID=2833582 RepID=UPI001BCA50BA|nr:late competence development ComFB family protein [Bacillus sp. FJAT-49736]MBS4174144.1 late competence development ComFB family protein [Bacillus sp. FJAT-49736]
MPIYNVMEEIVKNVLDENIEQLHLPCTCERCRDDIQAIALNQLPPHYIANRERSPYIRAGYTADRQGATNILSAIIKASKIVGQNRRCQIS